MARNNVERKVFTGGGSITGKRGLSSGSGTIKKATSNSGIGYTRTATSRSTGQKTTSTGTTKAVTRNEYNGSGRSSRKSTPRTKRGGATR